MRANGPDQPHIQVLPEQRVGQALRNARQAAGLGLRVMARRLNYSSHSTLSEYENGVRMPSERIVEGYERLLNLTAGTLTAVLEAANVERHGDAWIRRRVHVPFRVPGEAASVEMLVPFRTGPGAVAASPWSRQPVADGSDPDAAGCSVDAVTLHARKLALAKRRIIIGHVELRYCARAGAMWGRFEGYGYLEHLARERDDVQIIVRILRHSDSACIATKEQYCFDHMWSDLLVADSGMFQAAATVLVGHETVGVGETDRFAPFAVTD
jgi:transcriptional regulator with XRE-family HTH domain